MNKKYFRVRAFPNHVDKFSEFIEEGFIAIGWPKIGDITNNSKEKITQKLSVHYPELEDKALSLTTGFFVRLLAMKKDDIILIPYNNEIIVIAKVIDRYIYNCDFTQEHTAHRVSIEVLKEFEVADLPLNLKKSINTISTVISLDKYKNEIDLLLSDKYMTIETNQMKSFFSDNTEKKIALHISNNVNFEDLKKFISRINL